jgi:RNA polymerase sigma-70 factor (ECF subfamily)
MIGLSSTYVDIAQLKNNEDNQDHKEQVQRLFLENIGLIRGFVFALVRDRDRTKDIFQDVFMIATRKADQFQLGSNFLAWVRAIVRFRVLEEQRQFAKRAGSHLELDSDLMEALAETSLEIDDSYEARRRALAYCLEKVASRSREILHLRFLDGFSPTEIARKLSWSVNAVRVALSRVRRAVFKCAVQQLVSNEGAR